MGEIVGKIKGYVWYASYGSNINRERFFCYIRGGQPIGSSEVEVGCRDHSIPVDESPFIMNRPLYFAKKAARWDYQGVAFIGQQKSEHVTFSKKYLITTEQFLDVVKQENSGVTFDIGLSEVKEIGSKIFCENSWYGNILYLGESKGFPIFTFTAPWDMTETELKKPSHAYLRTIINGLKVDYSNEEIYDYFINKPGIKGYYSINELASLIF